VEIDRHLDYMVEVPNNESHLISYLMKILESFLWAVGPELENPHWPYVPDLKR